MKVRDARARSLARGLLESMARGCFLFPLSDGVRRLFVNRIERGPTLITTSITPATLTCERGEYGLNPMELHRLQGILCARNICLIFDTSLFALSEQEMSMTKATTSPLVLGLTLHWIPCKSTVTIFTSTTSMLEVTRRRSSLSTRKSRVQTRGSGC